MIQIEPEKAYRLEELFESLTDSCAISCLEGVMGTAFADNAVSPECCAIHLGEYFYVGGIADIEDFLKEAFEYARKNSLNIVTLNEDIQALAKNLYGDKCILRTRYQMNNNPNIDKDYLFGNIDRLSDEFELALINENIYNQALENEWSEYFCKNFKSYEDFSGHAFGYVILKDNKLVSGTSCYSYYSKGYEIVIATSPEYRRQGLALISASAFLLECDKNNKIPHWDAANEKSLALSQKLGYSLCRKYTGITIQ